MKNATFLEAVTSNRTAYCFYAGERVLFGRANEIFEYNMVTHSRDFSHELVTYQLFNY